MRILITGARSGIAYQTALRLEREGHSVYLCVHTEEQQKTLQEKVRQEQLNILVFKLDITRKEDLVLLDQLYYDVLWAHAGIGNGGTLLAMPVDVLRKNYDVNVFGTMDVIKRAYSNFHKNHIKGKIFVTSSLAGMLPFPYLSCYTSSKAALSMLCMTLKTELQRGRQEISISLIELGAYQTGFNEVMIENKDQYLDKNSFFYKNRKSITRLQKNLFVLIEKQDYGKLADKIAKEMQKENPKFKIRAPFLQVLFTKFYLLFFR